MILESGNEDLKHVLDALSAQTGKNLLDANVRGVDLYTPVMIAAKEGQSECVIKLVKNGADITALSDASFNPCSALLLALILLL